MFRGQLPKEMLIRYKRFEKCFLKADKSQDMIDYIKRKYQFRSMLMFVMLSIVSSMYAMIVHGSIPFMSCSLLFAILIGFRTKSYNTLKSLLLVFMVMTPTRFPTSSLMLMTPLAIFMSSVQILVQTQSEKFAWLHMAIQVVGFYFYGMDRISATIRGMSIEEFVESARTSMVVAFVWGIMTLLCMKMLLKQFSSLVKKVNALKDNISKANNLLNEQNLKLQNNLEMKDIFIYTFSHELKNALNGLLGNLHLAYDSARVPLVSQHLSSAKVCGEILKNFIHNILDSGKLENGNLEVAPERKDVMGFLQNVWTVCGRIIQNKRLKGLLEIEKNVPAFLDLDEQRMIQIILNLVSNACKFTEKGHVRIHVSWQTVSSPCTQEEIEVINDAQKAQEEEGRETTQVGDMREFPDIIEARPSKKDSHHLVTERPKKFISGSQFYELNLSKSHWNQGELLPTTLPEGSKGTLKIQVVDTGCGMTTEQQGKLFQKFSQVSSSQGQRKVGTGLGLWICKELANRLAGDITTRSVVGVGSVFELTIRARVSKVPEKYRKRWYKLQTDFLSDQSMQDMPKALIVDDDNFNVELMKSYLSKFGINYICAYDGEEAVSLFKKHYKEIGFVITDNFMPKKTGIEAALEIADFLEEKKRPKIPILCISGDLRVNIGERGITNVIQKPINFDRLKEELVAVYSQLALSP